MAAGVCCSALVVPVATVAAVCDTVGIAAAVPAALSVALAIGHLPRHLPVLRTPTSDGFLVHDPPYSICAYSSIAIDLIKPGYAGYGCFPLRFLRHVHAAALRLVGVREGGRHDLNPHPEPNLNRTQVQSLGPTRVPKSQLDATSKAQV